MLDLKNGVAVHAVKGERAAYAPVRSVLADSADPLVIADSFKRRLGLTECYVADLDAIARAGHHRSIVRAIADTGLGVWLDAGVSTAAQARQARSLGVRRVIVGSETLDDPGALASIAGALAEPGVDGVACAVLSIDLRHGRLLGGSPSLQALDPVGLAQAAWESGIRAFIVLDLARVGAAAGVETGIALRVRRELPGAEIAIGGGVRDVEDLRALAGQGFDAALVATALHTGVITATALSTL